MNFVNVLFTLSTALCLGSALGVLLTRNIMHACIYLLGTLMGIAGLYVTLGADLVAATQIMVYVGGIVILMVFAVMLTGGKDFKSKAQDLLNLVPSMGTKGTYLMGFFAALVMAFNFYHIISYTSEIAQKPQEFKSTINEIGYLLISKHVLAFEISSVLLLGALVGAALIARPRRELKEGRKES